MKEIPMKTNKSVPCVLGFMLLFTVAAASAAFAQNQTSTFDAATKSKIIKFNVPGAGTAARQGTVPVAINPKGWIAGYYIDSSYVVHGFLRSRKGKFTTIEPSGAVSSVAYSLNTAGDIAGSYADSSGRLHGFLYSDGSYTTFEARGAGTDSGQGTEALNIDPSGTTIAGYYIDSRGVDVGFVRAADGTITEFRAKGAGTGAGQGTWTASTDGINPSGAIAGSYVDASNVTYPFLRTPKGTIIKFKVPGAGTEGGQGVNASGINTAGTFTGHYLDSSNVWHSFVRAPKGKITEFNVKGAGTGSGQGTLSENINTAGAITGQYVDSSYVNHGFVRLSNGHITKFNVPGAGTGPDQGTIPNCNNTADAITGNYIDSGNVSHGFLRTP